MDSAPPPAKRRRTRGGTGDDSTAPPHRRGQTGRAGRPRPAHPPQALHRSTSPPPHRCSALRSAVRWCAPRWCRVCAAVCQYVYCPLECLCPQPSVHVYGVVASVRAVRPTVKDFVLTIGLVDPSLVDAGHPPVVFNIFRPEASQLPTLDVGDVLRLHRATIAQYSGNKVGGTGNKVTQFVAIRAQAEAAGSATGRRQPPQPSASAPSGLGLSSTVLRCCAPPLCRRAGPFLQQHRESAFPRCAPPCRSALRCADGLPSRVPLWLRCVRVDCAGRGVGGGSADVECGAPKSTVGRPVFGLRLQRRRLLLCRGLRLRPLSLLPDGLVRLLPPRDRLPRSGRVLRSDGPSAGGGGGAARERRPHGRVGRHFGGGGGALEGVASAAPGRRPHCRGGLVAACGDRPLSVAAGGGRGLSGSLAEAAQRGGQCRRVQRSPARQVPPPVRHPSAGPPHPREDSAPGGTGWGRRCRGEGLRRERRGGERRGLFRGRGAQAGPVHLPLPIRRRPLRSSLGSLDGRLHRSAHRRTEERAQRTEERSAMAEAERRSHPPSLSQRPRCQCPYRLCSPSLPSRPSWLTRRSRASAALPADCTAPAALLTSPWPSSLCCADGGEVPPEVSAGGRPAR